MSYDRIIRDALRLARAPRRFASGGDAEPFHPIGSKKYTENLMKFAKNSHLVDKSGNPIRLYHGTSDQISYFNIHHKNRKDAGWLGEGVYLTESPMIASNYATQKRGDADPNVMPLFARITNPYKATTEEKNQIKQIEFSLGKEAAQEYSRNWTNDLKSKGHDGVIYEGPIKGMTEYVIFEPENVKSAIGNRGTFDTSSDFIDRADGGAVGYASGGDTTLPRQLNDMGFYSSAAESARFLPQSKGTPQQMLATMKGVKPAELEWSGVQDKFAGQKSVTKDDLAEHFEQNAPDIKETVLGGQIDPEILKRRTEIKDMYWPEINRYRIMGDPSHIDAHHDDMIRRAARARAEEIQDKMWEHMDREAPLPKLKPTQYRQYTVGSRYGNESPSQRGYREVLLHLPGENKFQSSHWNPENILAHLRMQDRGPDNDILHLEELQSDWAQKGRDEGFKDTKHEENYVKKLDELSNAAYESIYQEGISNGLTDDKAKQIASKFKNMTHADLAKFFPNESNNLDDLFAKFNDSLNKIEPSPYVTNTDHWMELGLKRALLEAARGGYNKLVWTPGEEQAKRYDLSRHVDRVEYNPYNKKFNAYKDGNKVIAESGVEQDKVKNYIGSELAEKLNDKIKNQMSEDSDIVARINSIITKDTNVEMLYDVLSSRYGLEGLDLKVGGEGMKSFYDKMLPAALRRVLKPHTDKIQPTSHVVKGNDGENVTLPGIEITPEMRESILKKGFSYYARGGEVRQHFEVGGGADGGDSGGGDSSNGDGGGFSSNSDMADFGSQTEREDSSPAAPSYSPTDQDPSMLGGATGMAFSPLGSGSLGVGTGQVSGSVFGNAEQNLNTGPGVVGFIGGSPLGALAYAMEQINNTYYDGKARADVDQNVGGPSSGQNPTAADVVYPQSANPSGGFRLSSDDDETQAGMVKPVAFAPPAPPMMASGGKARNSHPVLSIPGVHIREEIHGRPIFFGDRDG